jgi:hypothetical protein
MHIRGPLRTLAVVGAAFCASHELLADTVLHSFTTFGTREPTIAIDPANPERVAASSLWNYSVSTNFGASWGATLSYPDLPGTFGPCGDPSFAFAADGSLYYSYLSCFGNQCEVLLSRVSAINGAILGGPYSVSNTSSGGFCNDKEWIAVDRTNGPYAGRIYAAWTEFPSSGSSRRMLVKSSSNAGATWTAAIELANQTTGFPWPCHVAVGPTGTVFVAWHEQPTYIAGGTEPWNPDGTSGRIRLARSTDGGATWIKTLPFTEGTADVTFNVQSNPGSVPQTDFWMQGSAQPWVLPHPTDPNRLWVIAADDPDNSHGVGDDADVMIVASSDGGATFGTPRRVDDAPAGALTVFPTAAIDLATGRIAVAWYDTRRGLTNTAGNFLLDVYVTLSDDGVNFRPAHRISDAPFNPDTGTGNPRFSGPPPTRRIGEYIGIDLQRHLGVVWTGNGPIEQVVLFDGVREVATVRRGDLNGDGFVTAADLSLLLTRWGEDNLSCDLNLDGSVGAADLASLLSNWG